MDHRVAFFEDHGVRTIDQIGCGSRKEGCSTSGASGFLGLIGYGR